MVGWGDGVLGYSGEGGAGHVCVGQAREERSGSSPWQQQRAESWEE